MASPPSQSVETRFRTIRIIHAALVGSLLIYAVMVHVLKEIVALPPTLDESALGVIRPAFYVMAGAIAVAVLVLRSRWLTVEAAPPSLATLQTRLINCLALAEAIGVFGLVLFMMGGMLRDFYVLWVPAIGLQLLLTPTREVWEAAAHGGRPRPR